MQIGVNIMSEQSLLLVTHHQHIRRFKYRLTCIRSRAAVLVLLWDLLFQIYKLSFIAVISVMLFLHEGSAYLLFILFPSHYLFYPVGGLIADVWIGRYRMIIISIYVCLVAWILSVIGYSLHWYLQGKVYIPVMLPILTIAACLFLGGAGFQSNILPFNIDQMMGASGDELSVVIHWHMFGVFFVYSCPIFTITSFTKMYFLLACLIISCITIILIIVGHCLFKHWLDTTPQITNPIKLIIRVLNYARKNKYPRNRSALTYWEEDYPSRLDLGKEKYGGPFSEEEVEDVKTVLRLLLLFICVVGFPASWGTYSLPIAVSGLGSGNVPKFFKMYVEQSRTPFFVCSLMCFLYQFIIYPCFYKHIPSMLKRIGMGLVFALLASIFYFIILIIGDFSEPSFECPSTIDNYSNTSTVIVNYKWLLIPHITRGCALFLVCFTTLEFIVAQSPRQMRGLMVGLSYCTYGIGAVMHSGFSLAFVRFKLLSRGCIFYFLIANFISFVVLTMIGFLVFIKCYTLRTRGSIVPIHQIAEEHYERYFDQSEEYRREYGLSRSDLTNDN